MMEGVQNGVQNGVYNGSPNGVDSIHFTTKSKMALHPTIKSDVDAVKGDSAVLIWRDNKGEMDRVPKEERGKFYKGDCYVIYNCQKKSKTSRPSIHIHFLIGSDSKEEDERMDVALQTTALDDYLGGVAVQFREIMFEESPEFTAIFNGKKASNLRYAEGGHGTRMRKVSTSNVTHLYEVKGKRNPQATEVPAKLASLNSDDCYVLDGGKSLFVLWGKDANNQEKRKAYIIACSIRDDEQGGRGHVHIIEEDNFNKNEHIREIRKLLDVAASGQLKFGNLKVLKPQSDEEADKKQSKDSKLYKISDAGGSVEIKELGSPQQCLLDTNDCFILDTGGKIYVWKGRRANPTEKRAAFETAQAFIKNTNLKPTTPVVAIPEYAETAAFRSCFPSWKDDSEADWSSVDYTKPYSGNQVAKNVHTVIDFRKLHEKPKKKAVVDDPYASDDGKSKALVIYRVDLNASQKRVECQRKGFVFNSSDCYVLVYQYGPSNKNCIIYYWLGNEADHLEKGTSAKIAIDIDDDQFNGQAIQERVLEGKEPPHFMRICDGFILVKQERLKDKSEHLFHVRGKRENDAKVIEVEADASKLNSNDSFILDCRKGIFLWYGKGSTGDEQRVAREAAAELYPKRGAAGNYTVFSEGKESADFWEGIGGKKPYATEEITNLQEAETVHEPRLFHCYNIKGSLEVEEVYDFDQDDLNPDDIMFLDTYYRLYVWVGKGARRDELSKTMDFIQEFIREDPTTRKDTDPFYTVITEGNEPDAFKAFFGVWEDERVGYLSPEDQKRLALYQNEKITLYDEDPKTLYPLEVLQGVAAEDLPYEVDVLKRELYLLDEDFQNVFGMSKEEFKSLPSWKRDDLRKAYKLF